MMALVPYIIVIAVFSIAKLFGPVKTFLVGTDVKIEWPGLHGNVLSAAGKPISSTIYNFQWLSSPGSLLVLCGILTAICYRISPAVAAREYFTTAYKLRWAFLTVAAVLALAYVMNQSGQTLTIGNWIAATGAFFAFLSPVLGWLGTAVTGSDTSANALFATLQQAAAQKSRVGPDPARGRQHHRRRGRQDDQPAEPHDRRNSRGHPGPRGRPVPVPDPVEPRNAPVHVRARVPAIHPGARLDALRRQGDGYGDGAHGPEQESGRRAETRSSATDHVRTGRGDVEPYARDATPLFRGVPDVVVWPRHRRRDRRDPAAWPPQRGMPVVPRGAGSNLCGATAALTGGIVLVLTRMNRILEVSADELLARVESGVTTAALTDAAAARGLLYAPDPGSRTVSTIGGNVATCAGGLRGLKYGVTRNYVLGVDGGAAHRRDDPDRRPAVEGRGRATT